MYICLYSKQMLAVFRNMHARWDLHKARFPLAELTGRQHGRSTRKLVETSGQLVETRACQHGLCWRVTETGHPSTQAVNSGRQLG